MTPFDDLIQATREEFLRRELPDGLPLTPGAPTIAAIGTTADKALGGAFLRERLAAAGVSPAGYRAYPDPAALMGDRSWALALVLSPFKRAVPAACGALTPAARATGVVDTILQTANGTLGVNTNAYAADGAVRHLLGSAAPARVLIAGTGASARSVAVGVSRAFPDTRLLFVGRTPERTAALVEQLGLGEALAELAAAEADVVINATTVGETGDEPMAYDLGVAFGPGVRYFDLNNRLSALQTSALTAGCVVSSGIVMQALTNGLRAALLSPVPASDRR